MASISKSVTQNHEHTEAAPTPKLHLHQILKINSFHMIYKKISANKKFRCTETEGPEGWSIPNPITAAYSFPGTYFMVVMSIVLVITTVLNTTIFTVGGRDLASFYIQKLNMGTDMGFSPKRKCKKWGQCNTTNSNKTITAIKEIKLNLH